MWFWRRHLRYNARDTKQMTRRWDTRQVHKTRDMRPSCSPCLCTAMPTTSKWQSKLWLGTSRMPNTGVWGACGDLADNYGDSVCCLTGYAFGCIHYASWCMHCTSICMHTHFVGILYASVMHPLPTMMCPYRPVHVYGTICILKRDCSQHKWLCQQRKPCFEAMPH